MIKLVIKSEEERVFEAVISDDDIDLQNEIVPSKVMEKAFKVYNSSTPSGGELLLLHKNIPVGRLTDFKITSENGRNTFCVTGKIYNDGRSVHTAVWEEMKKLKPISPIGFSIGAKSVKFHYEDIDGKEAVVHDEIELYEVSVICSIDGLPHQPANPRALLRATANAVPGILVKMVTDMPKDEKEEKEELDEEKADDEEDAKSKSETDESTDLEKQKKQDIANSIRSEATKMYGGKETITLLATQKEEISNLNIKIKSLDLDVKKHIAVVEEKDGRIALLNKQLDDEKVRSQTWKQMFEETINKEDVIQKMIHSESIVVNKHQVPANQAASRQNNQRKEYDLGLIKEYNDRISKDEYVKDTSKYLAAASRLEENDYGGGI